MIASCGFLEEELRQFSKEEGVTLAGSVETLGVDLRTRVKRLGAKENARRKKCNVRFSIIKKIKTFRRSAKKLLRAGVMPARTCGAHAVGMSPTEQRMGPKPVNCCKPEQMGTKECGKMLKKIQTLEDGRVPAKEANNWMIEGQN